MTAIALNQGFDTSRIAGFAATLRARFNAWNLRRETRIELNHLTNRQLADIGLNRSNIDAALRHI